MSTTAEQPAEEKEGKVVEIGSEQPASPPPPVSKKDTSSTSSVQDKAKLLEESKQRSLDVIAGAQSLLIVVILGLACIVAFSSRLFAVIRFESIIHEFDPWYVNAAAFYGCHGNMSDNTAVETAAILEANFCIRLLLSNIGCYCHDITMV